METPNNRKDSKIFHEILEKYWGYKAFRPVQEDIIQSIFDGKDTLGLMPTGGGKSITFQVPALAMDGICLVITPLIALMKDQVDNLQRIGIKATTVYSGMSRQEVIVQLENCIFGDYKFLYVSPERLTSELFQSKLSAMKVCLLAIDESHCISQWGYDFRPSYLNISAIREKLPNVPVLALTASATPAVVKDIQSNLRFKEENVFQKSFFRHNLAYIKRSVEDKEVALTDILRKTEGCTIVYMRSRGGVKEIAELLQRKNIPANFFHAGLNKEEKHIRQMQWKDDETRVIVSTNAFGMGIDKSDVRLVIHMDMPGSLEEYYQEAGRAGRDEKPAYAIALYSKEDNTKLKRRISNEYPDKDFIKRVYEALCNYLQIAEGYGINSVHDFTIMDFCKAFKFPVLPTHHALKILELSGYIEYTEEIESASRLIFLATKEELYHTLRQDRKTDELIQIILRSYTGLFSDYVYINESYIATRTGITQGEVYEILMRLSKFRLIKYIPHKKTPLIIFTQNREAQKYLSIPKTAYENRKEKSEERINKVLGFFNEEHICRSRMILSYFGEKEAKNCNKCDTCLKESETPLSNEELESIRELLIKTLTEPTSITALAESLPYSAEKSIAAIRFLIDNEEQFILKDGVVSLKEQKIK